MKYQTREQWLEAAVELMKPVFEGRKYKVPRVRVSCSFPSTKATSLKSRRLGECWDGIASADGIHQIFITPLMDDVTGPQGVLSVLLHEVVHAVVGIPAKHGPKFKDCATAVGLEGKMTSTVAGPILLVTLAEWAEKLGAYPHSKIDPGLSGRKKQTTRMRKCTCTDPECGFTVRTTTKWIEAVGAPWCPEHGAMEVEPPKDGEPEEGGDE